MLQQSQRTEQKEYSKDFSLVNIKGCLHNRYMVKQRENYDVQGEKIINYPVEGQDNIMNKVFQLKLPTHTIIIRDTFTIIAPLSSFTSKQYSHPNDLENSHPESSAKKDQNKKLILFRNSINKDPSTTKGDKKNIAKNVITAFINYLRDRKIHGQNFDPQIQKLKGLIDKTKFNNQLINLIAADTQLRHYFLIFLNSSAEGWVQHSKLKNKQIHVEAINIYRRLCEQKQSENQQQQVKKREQEPMNSDEDQILFQSAINHELENEIKDFK